MSAVPTGRRGRARALADRMRYRWSWTSAAWWVPPLYALWLSLTKLPGGDEKLVADASTYYSRAIHFAPERWWEGDVREPLFPLANSVILEVFGESPTTFRVTTVVVFVALVVATQYLAREFFGTWGAIAVGATLALSEWLALQAVSGLREEAATLGLVLVALAVIRMKPGWRYPVLLALLVAASAMIRWDTLIVSLPVVAWAYLRHRVPLRQVAASVAVFGVIVAPFLAGNADQFDDPMMHSNIHSIFFRNVEFQGKPGYVSREEFAENAFAGPEETWFSYLFEDHDVGWVAEHTFEGTFNTALTNWGRGVVGPTQTVPRFALPTTSMVQTSAFYIPWVMLFVMIAGAVLILRRRHGWVITAMLFLALVQHAPIQHIMDPRLSLSAYPFMVIAAGVALSALWSRFLAAAGRAAAPAQARR
jgi:hypothetical protein